jgi:hypothetical protein
MAPAITVECVRLGGWMIAAVLDNARALEGGDYGVICLLRKGAARVFASTRGRIGSCEMMTMPRVGPDLADLAEVHR